MNATKKYFLPYQQRWLLDQSPLRIIQKSRQVGITYVDAYDSVIKAGTKGARLDVWISSRDQPQAKLYLEDCKYWATFLHLAATDLGEVVLDKENNISAYVLQFANGRRIYPIVWTDILTPCGTAAAPDANLAVFGALSFWWMGEHGTPRIDTSQHVWFANDQLAVRFIEEIDFDYAAEDATAVLLTAAA
jgi:hypothetical protein